jgi:hypothetical protein
MVMTDRRSFVERVGSHCPAESVLPCSRGALSLDALQQKQSAMRTSTHLAMRKVQVFLASKIHQAFGVAPSKKETKATLFCFAALRMEVLVPPASPTELAPEFRISLTH